DVDAVLARLEAAGIDAKPRSIDVGGVRLVVVTDPDGVMVELMDAKAQANLDTITGS
ncbi:MAG: hypothetical protein JWM89_1324, partial [Acidimicrobiales bacterium]|nr:hypothetical protein [Acidimicrobiales bacterium]